VNEDESSAPAQDAANIDLGPSWHHGRGDINQAGHDIVQHIYANADKSFPIPRQLPATVHGFVDRTAPLARLNSILTPANTGSTRAAAVVGTAGIGKTALALRWARSARSQYTDGDLYVNLRGYDPDGPADPLDVLDGFLRAFDFPPDKMPARKAERAALFRAVLAPLRVLIVLDNAATADQVRPLLPGSNSCAVLITSRSRLAGLSIRDGVSNVDLELLPPDEAVLLLTELIGRRTADDPESTSELARLCAYLPLALRIVAEKTASRPWARISDTVADLRTSKDRLDMLTVDDDELTSVRAVFSWSYQSLQPAAAAMFRLLGLHSGPDISTGAAAALSDSTPTEARQQLDVLLGVHLIDAHEHNRYQLHDLLSVYAAERARFELSAEERAAAQRRELTWYLHAANNADLRLNPHRRHVAVEALEARWSPARFATRAEALLWCETERLNCVVAVRRAAEIGALDIAWRLPLALNSFFYLRWYVADWAETATIGVGAARQLHDPLAEAWSLTGLSGAFEMVGDLTKVIECCEEALPLWRLCDDRRGEILSLHNLGNVYRKVGRLEEAFRFETAGLRLAEDTGDSRMAGLALTGLGHIHSATGRFNEAIECFQQALLQSRHAEDKHTEGQTLRFLADGYRRLGQDAEARLTYHQALRLQRVIGDQRGEGDTLMGLGAAELHAGHPAAAATAWRSARDIFVALNEPQLRELAEDALRNAGSTWHIEPGPAI
jgi:tetratricopeptide (TPR) repeat protein